MGYSRGINGISGLLLLKTKWLWKNHGMNCHLKWDY